MTLFKSGAQDVDICLVIIDKNFAVVLVKKEKKRLER